MDGRLEIVRFWMRRVLCVFLMLQLQCHMCFSMNSEGMALLKFRSRLEVDPYGALENWNPRDGDPCNWFGVHCIDGKVETLILKQLALGGALAPELGVLRHLRALVLSENNFYGAIPKEIGGLPMLVVLDLRGNNLSGTIPAEIGEILPLKHLLLCGNKFQGGGEPSWTEKFDMISELDFDQNLSADGANEVGSVNRKVGQWSYLKRGSSHGNEEKHLDNLQSFAEPVVQNMQQIENSARRRLLQENSNLQAVAPADAGLPQGPVMVPSTGSGSFPASLSAANANDKGRPGYTAPKDLLPTSIPTPSTEPPASEPDNSVNNDPALNEKFGKWGYLLVLPGIALLLSLIAAIFMCRKKAAGTIGPWKTGLSGQLQKAFITGVPKLNRAELEAACEDFSNIITTFPDSIIFKGTLSSGVEIAVLSTTIKSAKDWTKRSEMNFRKKIDTLSRINHKNFVNLLGYCEENEPFMRMMVFEYASNGTLYEHIHIKEFDQLDWSARMRIVMGAAYCLQYMHHELNPPIAHPDLDSSSIYLTDDYAAKIASTSIWKEIVARKNMSGSEDMDSSETSYFDPGSIVYNFALLMLEIISGKLPSLEEQGSVLNLVADYLNEKSNVKDLIDPTLKNFKNNELDAVCEVIQDCTLSDPKKRPTMKEITARLRESTGISPDAATPRLSPLWWAELEILSVEAS